MKKMILRYYTLCVADVTDMAPVDSEIVTVAVIEEDDEHDETTSLMSTEKIELAEGITIPHKPAM